MSNNDIQSLIDRDINAQDALDLLVHAGAAELASQKNNLGLKAQLAFLATMGMSRARVEEVLLEAAA